MSLSKVQLVSLPAGKLPWGPTNVRKALKPNKVQDSSCVNCVTPRLMQATFEEPCPRDPSFPPNDDEANGK